jgi:acetoin utilization protein AcuB
MIAEELINQLVPPLKPSDDAHKAMIWMEEFRSNQLPVVSNEMFLGFITEETILEVNDIEKRISEFELSGVKCFVSPTTHFYEVLKVASENNLQMVAVIDELQHYAGVITVQDTLTTFAQTAAVQMPGGIIVLSMEHMDYSLAEISRLIEENNARILSSTVKEDSLDKGKIKLTLKINRTDLSRIVATLERFDYKIIARYEEINELGDQKERLDMLMRYLDI